jgi:hypothetical protein
MSKKPKVIEKVDPYEEGVEAAHSNRSQADCPYSFSSPEGEQWVQGYQDGGGID